MLTIELMHVLNIESSAEFCHEISWNSPIALGLLCFITFLAVWGEQRCRYIRHNRGL